MNIFELTTEQLEELSFDERGKLHPNKKQMKSFQKHLIFYVEEKEVSYKSMEEMWLDQFLEEETTTPFKEYVEMLENHEGDTCLCHSVSDLVALYNEHCHGETEFPCFNRVKYEVLDAYVDYKRGHEDILEIFELNYKALGMKRPKKSERQYFGITYTMYQDGGVFDYSGLQQYQLVKKKIVVEEWEPV